MVRVFVCSLDICAVVAGVSKRPRIRPEEVTSPSPVRKVPWSAPWSAPRARCTFGSFLLSSRVYTGLNSVFGFLSSVCSFTQPNARTRGGLSVRLPARHVPTFRGGFPALAQARRCQATRHGLAGPSQQQRNRKTYSGDSGRNFSTISCEHVCSTNRVIVV